MSANTTQRLFEKVWKFWVFSIWPMIQEGKRSAQDVLDMLRLVKDKPKEWELHVSVLRGTHHIVPVEAVFTVDTTNASMPEEWRRSGWTVEEHKSLGVVRVRFAGGEMYINDRGVDEYFAEKQRRGGIVGYDLHTELADKPTLPDAILDLLIREQDNPAVKLFFQKHKSNHFFWGTIYRSPEGSFFVRRFGGDGWRFVWYFSCLVKTWFPGCPALVLAHTSNSGA